MSNTDLFLTILGFAVLCVFVSLSFLSGWGLVVVMIIGGVILLLSAIYFVVKRAVKAALREYEKEKAEANGQK